MSRHLNNLQRVLNKMQMRYGAQDEVVRQLQQEIVQQQASVAPGSQALPVNERRRVAGRATQRSDDPVKALAPRAWRMAQSGNPRNQTH